MNPDKTAIAIMGATATGKSDLAIELAECFGGEIISMDSRQVYRGFDIGTGKVSTDDMRRVPHHLIDNLDPQEPNSAGAHLSRAIEIYDRLHECGRPGLFVGGTGLYFRALFNGLISLDSKSEEKETLRKRLEQHSTDDLFEELAKVDPDRAGELARADRMRILRSLEIFLATGKAHSMHIAEQTQTPAWGGVKIVLTMPRLVLRASIARRTRRMYEEGWCEEVRALLESGVALKAPAMNGLGYSEIARAIIDGENPEDTVEKVITLTQQFAKRQETFFRSVSDAEWVDVATGPAFDRVKPLIQRQLEL